MRWSIRNPPLVAVPKGAIRNANWIFARSASRPIGTRSSAELRRTLAPDGVLYVATDHAEYYSEILPRLRAVLSIEEHPRPWEDAPAGRTNYEVKYLKAGRPIYRLIGRKT